MLRDWSPGAHSTRSSNQEPLRCNHIRHPNKLPTRFGMAEPGCASNMANVKRTAGVTKVFDQSSDLSS